MLANLPGRRAGDAVFRPASSAAMKLGTDAMITDCVNNLISPFFQTKVPNFADNFRGFLYPVLGDELVPRYFPFSVITWVSRRITLGRIRRSRRRNKLSGLASSNQTIAGRVLDATSQSAWCYLLSCCWAAGLFSCATWTFCIWAKSHFVLL